MWEFIGIVVGALSVLLIHALIFAQGLKDATWSEQRTGLFGQAIWYAMLGGIILMFVIDLGGEQAIRIGIMAAVAGLYFWFAWRSWRVYRHMGRAEQRGDDGRQGTKA